MGIRYYAYAFDSHQTARALANPLTVLRSDPLAHALGLEPDFTEGVSHLRQSLPERDFLYLDKAWPYLQLLTGPGSAGAGARAAYRMFEGAVTYRDGGWTWHPAVAGLRTRVRHQLFSSSQRIRPRSGRGRARICLHDRVTPVHPGVIRRPPAGRCAGAGAPSPRTGNGRLTRKPTNSQRRRGFDAWRFYLGVRHPSMN